MNIKTERPYIILNENTEPAFNLACEEYLLRGRNECFLMLWRNSPSIIIGLNQNAYAELDIDYVRSNNLPVIRRLTGGGAVCHDLGNLNFTFIFNGSEGLVDFCETLSPITDFLRSLGLNASFSGRNDILIDGLKVSGCAQTNDHGRTLLHGTLLYSSDLTRLSRSLRPNDEKLKSKGIRSVASRVTNISEHLSEKTDVIDFRNKLYRFLLKKENCIPYTLCENDIIEIEALKEEKYSTFKWNFGSSPPCTREKTMRIGSGWLSVGYTVKDAKIDDIRFFGDYFGCLSDSPIEEKLKGLSFEPDAVAKALADDDLNKYISGITLSELIDLIFN